MTDKSIPTAAIGADEGKGKEAASSDECTCPEHGTWLHADDINRMVRELDVAMNGEGGATTPKLCDIFRQLKERVAESPSAVAFEAGDQQAQSGLDAMCQAYYDAGGIAEWRMKWPDQRYLWADLSTGERDRRRTAMRAALAVLRLIGDGK
jgi:hypothetical protein